MGGDAHSPCAQALTGNGDGDLLNSIFGSEGRRKRTSAPLLSPEHQNMNGPPAALILAGAAGGLANRANRSLLAFQCFAAILEQVQLLQLLTQRHRLSRFQRLRHFLQQQLGELLAGALERLAHPSGGHGLAQRHR